MKIKKICFFNRSSVHYRQNIYNLLDKELCVDFFFGDSRPGNIKEADYSQLHNFKGFLHNITFGPFYWQRGVIKFLWSDYDIIITPGDTYCISTWLLLLLYRITNKKVYIWTHGAYGNEMGFKKFLTIFRIYLCSGAFLYGNYAKNILINYGVCPNKLYVIYNSLAYDQQITLRKQLIASNIYRDHFNNDNKNLIFIGRLTKVKKLDLILDALNLLKDSNIILNITYVGDGIEQERLMELTNNLGLQTNVWFYGACYDEKIISELLFNADICISPGNVGLTAMHAMTFGCPVISHSKFTMQMPEFEAIEDGISGTFFTKDDAKDLSRAIYEWIQSGKSRDFIRQTCYEIIDSKYNPHVQIQIIKKAIL